MHVWGSPLRIVLHVRAVVNDTESSQDLAAVAPVAGARKTLWVRLLLYDACGINRPFQSMHD